MMILIFILLGAVAGLWVLLLVSPAHRATFRFRVNADTPLAECGEYPAVTVIVPARNEGKVLGRAIPSMCLQDYPDLRVILVDDQSDDNSPEVIARLMAEHSNLKVVHGRQRPEGWCGKPWAVQQGVEAAMSESAMGNRKSEIDTWLLFTDADCIFHPRVVRQAMKRAQADSLDLVSVFPSLTFSSTIERVGVLGLVTVLVMMFPLGWANDPNRRMALSAGAFMLVKRSAYNRAGGHEAVKAHIIEDVNLGKNVKATGARVQGNFTQDLIQTEMYENFGDLWEGLAKNAYAGMEYQPHKFWAGIMAGILVAILPPVYLVATMGWAVRAGTTTAYAAFALAGLINLCMLVIHARTVRFMRAPWYDMFLLPVSAFLYNLIALSSMWQNHFSGGNVWKGRRYHRKMLLESVATTDKEGKAV
jgi:hopene-associated glycosyltransferase HpnB